MMNESLQTSSTGNYQQMTVSLSALRRQKMSTVEVDEVEQQGGTLNVTGNQPWNAVESVPIEGLISQGDLTKARSHLATVTFKVPKAFAVNGKNFCELEILGQADEIFRSASGSGQLLVPQGTEMVRNTEQALVGREVVVGG